jgi:hypothetical protein
MTRTVAIGDPQCTAPQFFAVLARHDLLGGDGWLRRDVQLVSMGDHFDFKSDDPIETGRHGVRILDWLAAHPREQVTILLGNHDVSRVMEMSEATDARMAETRARAKMLADVEDGDPALAAWARDYPELPAPNLLAKDYESFSEAQRALVQRLLLAGRFSLAATATIGSAPVLMTHAGVTERQVDQLGVPATPEGLATVLAARLATAIDGVRDAWAAGRALALSFGALYLPGAKGRDDAALPEGGGLLYHRPSNPDRANAVHRDWETNRDRPRRFHPRTLPRGLRQVVGHTNHKRCVKEMADWMDGPQASHASLRTITLAGDTPRYRAGVYLEDTCFVMTDPHLSEHRADEIDILVLDPGSVANY